MRMDWDLFAAHEVTADLATGTSCIDSILTNMNSELDTDKLDTDKLDTEKTDEPAVESEAKRVLDVAVDVTAPSACQRHVKVTVSRDDIDHYFGEEFDKLMPEAQVPGFRAGRAPRKLVESHFRKDVMRQIKGRLLLDCITQVSDEQKFTAIGEPDFDFEAVEIPDEGPLTFEFDLEVRPEFEMPEWKGLRLERPTMTIGKAEIDEHLARLLERFAVVEPVEDAAQLNDFVTLNIVFSHNGKRIRVGEELSARVRPTLSFRDGNLDGFDKLMVGARCGGPPLGAGHVDERCRSGGIAWRDGRSGDRSPGGQTAGFPVVESDLLQPDRRFR